MASNKELEAGLKAMAADFRLPADGRLKLSKLVAGHLHWFEAAERRGMVWRDMIRALAAIGVTDKRGKPLSVGTLSSAVWRKRAEARDVPTHASPPVRQGAAVPAQPRPKLRKEVEGLLVPQAPRSRQAASRSGALRLNEKRQPETPSKQAAHGGRRQNEDVFAFMDRARAVRSRSD